MQAVITGLGVVSPCGIGKDNFWQALEEGKSCVEEISSFDTAEFSVKLGGEIKNFNPKDYLDGKSIRNLDRSALLLLAAAKLAMDDAKIYINDDNTDKIGVCTGTTFSHLWSIVEFDKEVFNDGLDFANPALFPSTVINAASSHVSIRYNIQGFNTTISTGYTSALESLRYALNALDTQKAQTILCGSVESLTYSLFFGIHKLKYMAGFNGLALSCPFDKRRNGPMPAEGAVVFCVEDLEQAKIRAVDIFAKVRSVSSFFDAYKIAKLDAKGEGIEKSIKKALDEAGVGIKDIDYISSCANSSPDLDSIEAKTLKRVFGDNLKNIPVSSIKSMLGETFSASAGLQIASCVGAMHRGIIPPTINYKEKDPECDIDCVPNKARKKDVQIALVVSSGPGGYSSAAVLEKYTGD